MTTREQRRRRHRRHKRAAARRTKLRLWQRDCEPRLNLLCSILSAPNALLDDLRFVDVSPDSLPWRIPQTWLHHRTKKRMARNVEGTNQV